MTKSIYAVFSFILAFFVAVLIYSITMSTATLAFALFILFFGNFFTFVISDKQDKSTILNLFNIVYCVYVLLALNYFLGYQADWSIFTVDWSDEYRFYLKTDENQYLTIKQNFTDSFIDFKYLEYGSYVFYISLIASIAYTFFDGNHLLLQFLGTVIFGALTSVIIFKMLNIYISNRKSFYYTLVFMFFSVFNFYSFSLLRDIHIAFFYTWGVYLVLSDNPKSLKGLTTLLIINIIIWQLRFEHGLFFSLLVFYYGFNLFKKNKFLLVTLGLASIVFVSVFSLSYINKAASTLDRYSEFTQEAVSNKEDSFGQYIYKLPPVAKQAAVIVNSQIQPFPSWLPFRDSENIYRAITGALQIIYTLFWFIIFYSLVKWIVFERRIAIFHNEFLVISLICMFFLLANTANMTLRRIVVFYPFIYLIYVLIRESSVTSSGIKKANYYGLFTYLSLVIFYLILKL